MNAVVALLPGTVMVTAGGLCVCGAVAARRWIGIASAAVMLAAMVDLAFLGALPPLIWAVALVAAGLLLGLELRRDSASPVPPVSSASAAARVERGIAVASALAYPVMAWQILAHGGREVGAAGPGAHAGHGSAIWLVAVLLTLALAAALAILAVLGARRRIRLAALESAAMAAMLLVMSFAHAG